MTLIYKYETSIFVRDPFVRELGQELQKNKILLTALKQIFFGFRANWFTDKLPRAKGLDPTNIDTNIIKI